MPISKVQKVQLGSNTIMMVEVLKGIKRDDMAVSQGAYLLNSDYSLKYEQGLNLAIMVICDMTMSGNSK
jgi:hypothetical protein